MEQTPTGFVVKIPPENITKNTSDVIVETKENPHPQAPSLPLTKRQKMVRAKNKVAKQSRKKNRN
jgi:hypothetical protein